MRILTVFRPLWQSWLDEIERNQVVALWLLLWGFNAALNARLGYEIAGGQGPVPVLFGGVFFALAGFGAWAASQRQHATGRRAHLLGLVVIIQLCVGQMAGWQSFGLTLSRGAGMLESKAESRTTTHDALKRARADLEKIGTVRPVAAIKAEEVLECEKKSRRYPDGIGPACTKLRAELATAERARKLEADIAALTGQLGTGAQIKDANALYQVPQAIAQSLADLWSWIGGGKAAKVTPDDVRFGWLVFIVFALEFLATLGPALLGIGQPASPGAGGGPGGRRHGPTGTDLVVPDFNGPEWQSDKGREMRAAVERLMGGAWPALPRPPEPVALAPAGPAAPAHGGSAYGAPINIHVGGAGPQALLPAPGTDDFQIWPPDPPAKKRGGPARPDRLDMPAIDASAPPADRSKIVGEVAPEDREALDVILKFSKACVVDAPGGVIDAEKLWARYQHWAGARAVSRAAFDRLFVQGTQIEAIQIGEFPHYRGVALRAAPALREVA